MVGVTTGNMQPTFQSHVKLIPAQYMYALNGAH